MDVPCYVEVFVPQADMVFKNGPKMAKIGFLFAGVSNDKAQEKVGLFCNIGWQRRKQTVPGRFRAFKIFFL